MADYDSALTTSLGDYLSHRAAQEGISKRELEKSIEIVPIDGVGDGALKCQIRAIKEFDKAAQDYDAVVDLKESHFKGPLFFSYYLIRGTGVKQK